MRVQVSTFLAAAYELFLTGKSRLTHVVGIVCFLAQAGLILHHTYFDASLQNAISFPHPPKPIAEPIRWHNYLDLNRWDSAHYEWIAIHGYKRANPSKLPYVVQWYPGYPLVARYLRQVTGFKISFIFSVLSAASTLAFWLVLWSPRMVSVLGSKLLVASSVLIIFWPGAYYWFAGMTEPLVGLCLVLILYLWFGRSFNWIVLLLACATGVKQLFLPVTVAIFTLEMVRSHPKPFALLPKIIVALTGFIAFGLFCLVEFGDFFASSNYCIEMFKKKITIFSLVNFNQYARYLWNIRGIIAFGGVFFLVVTAVKLTDHFRNWKEVGNFFRYPQADLPLALVLWWLAAACTAFFILGDSYALNPYIGMMRYHTANIPIFLLLGLQFREMRWWKIFTILLPLAWVFLYWQMMFTIQYWFWRWVS